MHLVPNGAPRRWCAMLLSVAAFVVVTAGLLPSAHAIPAFARKYETTCQTCHVPFPKLNPFGEAFRRNGYRFPGDEDEDATVDEPIPLGQDAHKKVFPDEVWPATLPKTIPLAVTMAGSIQIDPEPDTETDPEASFAGLAGRIGLTFATTFDDTFSVWAGAGIGAQPDGTAEAEIERAFLFIKPFDKPVLNFRIGRFEPQVLGFTIHRTLSIAPWILMSPVGDDSFTIDPVQLGFEANGVTGAGRFGYAVGVVEGGGDRVNVDKNVYSRIFTKIGGQRLDGIGGATESSPWRETSVQLGGFGHFGRSALGDIATASQEDTFFMVGGDVDVRLSDLEVLGAFAYGRNTRPTLADPTEEMTSYHVFAQADYVIFPWLIPTARFERRSIGEQTGDRVSGGMYVLLRANIRTQLLASGQRVDEEPFEFNTLVAGLNLAF